jgi:predicted MFS family arabinose efflux permease
MHSAAGIDGDDVAAKHTAVVLAIANALYGSAAISLFATAGLVGTTLAPSRAWATLPLSTFVIGTMCSTIPVALFMRRFGRKPGFIGGSLVGVAACLLSAWAIYIGSFALFTASTLLLGVYQASSQYYRFAAADAAAPDFRPKAISWVLTGGVVAAVFGTLVVMQTKDLFAPYLFVGCYLAAAVFAGMSVVVLYFLRSSGHNQATIGNGRPLRLIVRQPRLITAIACGTISYGIMSLVMTAGPIAMVDCGFTVNEASWVIQWHAVAMFLPSFFTGTLIIRFGVERITGLGMVMLAGAAMVALLGLGFLQFAVALVLLGLGWNFGFIGATTMVTDCYRASERNKVQALNDFTIFATVSLSALTSGALLQALGWYAVNYAVFPMVAIGLVLMLWFAAGAQRSGDATT